MKEAYDRLAEMLVNRDEDNHLVFIEEVNHIGALWIEKMFPYQDNAMWYFKHKLMYIALKEKKRERNRKCEEYVMKVLSEAYEKLLKGEIVNE